jgi:hypothetical protein
MRITFRFGEAPGFVITADDASDRAILQMMTHYQDNRDFEFAIQSSTLLCGTGVTGLYVGFNKKPKAEK